MNGMGWDGMGEVWVWSIGVFFFFFFWYTIYICFTACSIGIGIGIGICAIERLSVMERMEYHSSVVLYVARGVWISTSGGFIAHPVIA